MLISGTPKKHLSTIMSKNLMERKLVPKLATVFGLVLSQASLQDPKYAFHVKWEND